MRDILRFVPRGFLRLRFGKVQGSGNYDSDDTMRKINELITRVNELTNIIEEFCNSPGRWQIFKGKIRRLFR